MRKDLLETCITAALAAVLITNLGGFFLLASAAGVVLGVGLAGL